MKLEGKTKMRRIHFGEDDRWQGRPLYQAIVERCRKLDIRGAMVFQGIQGYAASTRIRGSCSNGRRMRRSKLQIIDTRENIQRLIPALDEVVSEGLIAMSDGGDQVHASGGTASAGIMSVNLYLSSKSE